MKLEKNETLIDIDEDVTFASKVIKSKVDEGKLKKLFSLLSGIYKDIKGSIVREYVSNAVDANIEAGNANDPIKVDIKNEGIEYYFTVEDFGVGLSPDRMEKVFFNYLSSTKEDTDDLIGGLKCQAPLYGNIYRKLHEFLEV